MSIEEVENELRNKQSEERNNLLITINQLEKILSKKKQAIIGLEKELINIFSGDSDLDKNIIMKMLVNTKEDVEKIKKQLGDHNKKLNEVNLKMV